MQTLVNLILITFITVNIIDISGIIISIKKGMSKILHVPDYKRINLPLISCSYCMSWWLSILYLLITANLNLPYISFALFMSYMTTPIKEIENTIYDLIIFIINKLHDKF